MTEQVKKDGVGFTPGPWSSQGVWVFTDDAAIAKAQYGGEEAPNFVTAEANAHLIAAAPELYAALERALDWLSSYPGGGTLGKTGPYEQARDALSRARGEA